MKKNELLRNSAVALAVSVVFLFYNRTVSAGILLGFLCSQLYVYLLVRDIDGLIVSSRSSRFSQPLRMALLALPMLAGCLYPDRINVFGAFAGLMIPKVLLYIRSFIERR